jgi:hypothetical protein
MRFLERLVFMWSGILPDEFIKYLLAVCSGKEFPAIVLPYAPHARAEHIYG